jgi:hypothetical protein
MILLPTIDFNVAKARQNGQNAVAGRVLFSFTPPAKVGLDEPWEVVLWLGRWSLTKTKY